MVRLEGSDLGLGPSMVPARLRQLEADAPGWVGAQKLALFAPLEKVTEGGKPIAGNRRTVRPILHAKVTSCAWFLLL